jgi:hypothetical protein
MYGRQTSLSLPISFIVFVAILPSPLVGEEGARQGG